MIVPPGRVVATLALALAASGCISVLPKAPPVQLYAFSSSDDAAQAAPDPLRAAPIAILALPTRFLATASGDRILTSRGLERRYLAHARWVAPAATLFDAAEARAFALARPAVTVSRNPEGEAPKWALRLDVEVFEARFAADPEAHPKSDTPTVVVSVRADLTQARDGKSIATRRFEVRRPADAARVGAIVAAFDAASTETLNQVVAWTVLTTAKAD
jgi:cholesterol transport system auxiliary component